MPVSFSQVASRSHRAWCSPPQLSNAQPLPPALPCSAPFPPTAVGATDGDRRRWCRLVGSRSSSVRKPTVASSATIATASVVMRAMTVFHPDATPSAHMGSSPRGPAGQCDRRPHLASTPRPRTDRVGPDFRNPGLSDRAPRRVPPSCSSSDATVPRVGAAPLVLREFRKQLTRPAMPRWLEGSQTPHHAQPLRM